MCDGKTPESVTGDLRSPNAVAFLLLAHAREEVTRAEAKASFILAAGGIAAAALLPSLLASDWTPGSWTDSPTAKLWWVGSTLYALAIAILGRTLWPRTETSTPDANQAPSYYRRIASYSNHKDLAAALSKVEPLDLVHEQLYEVSKVALAKYKLLKTALGLLGIAGILVVVAQIQAAYQF